MSADAFFFALAHRLLLLREHMWGISVPINIWGRTCTHTRQRWRSTFFFLPTRRSACRNKHYFSLYVTLSVTLEAVSLAFAETVLTLRPGSSVGPLNCWVLTTAQQFMIMLRKLNGENLQEFGPSAHFQNAVRYQSRIFEKTKKIDSCWVLIQMCMTWFYLWLFLWLLDTQRVYYLFLSLLIFGFFFPLMFLILQIKGS